MMTGRGEPYATTLPLPGLSQSFQNKGQTGTKTHPTQEQWEKVFQKKADKDTMDTMPGRVRAHATNTRGVPTEEDKAKLMAAGKCFHSKKQGHMSKNCPNKPAQARSAPDDSSDKEAIQATTSKPTNPFLVKKKNSAQDIICMITKAEDDVKDTIIQEVFMKQNFWNAQTQWPGDKHYARYVANWCTLLGYEVWKYQSLFAPLTQWPIKEFS